MRADVKVFARAQRKGQRLLEAAQVVVHLGGEQRRLLPRGKGLVLVQDFTGRRRYEGVGVWATKEGRSGGGRGAGLARSHVENLVGDFCPEVVDHLQERLQRVDLRAGARGASSVGVWERKMGEREREREGERERERGTLTDGEETCRRRRRKMCM